MGHATIEWVYVGVVIAILCYVGADAWSLEKKLNDVPPEAKVIKVTGQQWFWTFEHEDGTKEIGELHLVKGVPYRFEVTSKDVIHSFNTPDFAMMIDAVPGRINEIWFMPDQAGQFLIQCREYCGFSHYQMSAKLFVEEPTNSTQGASPSGNASSSLAPPSPGATATITT